MRSFGFFLYSRLAVLSLFLLIPFPELKAQKTVRFNVAKPELITTQSLKDFLTQTESPKIVVRYSTFDYDDSKYDLNYLYNVIEKEFVKAGYSVKDRVLFDEVVNRAEDIIDYTIIQEKTDTELIYEIVKLETNLDYTTDSYYNNKGIKTILYNEGQVHVKGCNGRIQIDHCEE